MTMMHQRQLRYIGLDVHKVTISAAIASEFAESDGLHQSGLILLGLLLFVLTFFVLAAARLMLLRLEKKAGN